MSILAGALRGVRARPAQAGGRSWNTDYNGGSITLPWRLDLSSASAYSDALRITSNNGGPGSHTHRTTGGWNNGPYAEFAPPSVGDEWVGVGSFGFSSVQLLYVAELRLLSDAFAQAESRNVKMLIVNQTDSQATRGMVFHADSSYAPNRQAPGPANGTIANYTTRADARSNPMYGPDDENVILWWGNGNREDEWVFLTHEFRIGTDQEDSWVATHAWTQDGVLNGDVIYSPYGDVVTSGDWSAIDAVGGYFNAGSFTQAADRYFGIGGLWIDTAMISPSDVITGF